MPGTSRLADRAPRQDNRRQQLLDAAARLFSRQGYHATSMRDIAKAVGMLSGSIYYHFESKEEMLLAVYEEGVRRATEEIDSALAGETGAWKRLVAACTAHLRVLIAHPDYTQVMLRTLPQDGGSAGPRLRELRHEYESRFRLLIDELNLPASVDRRYLRLLLIGGLNWSPVWYRPGSDPPEVVAARFLDVLRRDLDPPS